MFYLILLKYYLNRKKQVDRNKTELNNGNSKEHKIKRI